jgi:hypothetical protein
MTVIKPTARSLFSLSTWRHWWDLLRKIEEAMTVTETELQERRISRLEAEVAELRAKPRG